MKKRRPLTCVPDNPWRTRTPPSQRQTRAAAQKDGSDGGPGWNVTTVDDDDTRRKRPFQVQARADRHCGNDPWAGRDGMLDLTIRRLTFSMLVHAGASVAGYAAFGQRRKRNQMMQFENRNDVCPGTVKPESDELRGRRLGTSLVTNLVEAKKVR